MTKKLFILTLIGLISATSSYAKCDGGTEVSISSGTFCMSSTDMNWWSAEAWCKANGRKMATMYDIAVDWDGNTGSDKAPEIPVPSHPWSVWTATASGSEAAFYIGNDGSVNTRNRASDYYHPCRAFCR